VASGAPLLFVALLLLAQAREPGAGRTGRRRLGSLTGSVSNRVIEELDVDAIIQRVDVDAIVRRVDVDGVIARVDVDGVLTRVDVNVLLDRVDPDRLLDRVDPDRLLERVDPDRLLDRVDPARLLDRVDPDRLLDRVDIDRLLARADVEGLLTRLDVDGVVARIDLDAVLSRVDLDALVARVDLDAVLSRVDLDALVARIDLDAILSRVDLDALVARIDLDAALLTVDVEGLTRRAGIPDLIAESTGQAANSALDLTRRQLVAVDVGLVLVLQRLLRRDPGALPPGPPRLLTDRPGEVQDPDLSRSRTKARIEVSGHYAGPASRLVALAGDLAASTAAFTATAVTISWLLSVIFGVEFDTTQRFVPGWVAALAVWYLLWWWGSVSIVGRTPVMALVGLKVVSRDGSPIRTGRALLRTLVLPFSLGLFGAGLLLSLIDRERRAFHDLVAGTALVYDWGGRPAELPTPISRWLEERGGNPDGAGRTHGVP
jgi:uncharacterized RDD family membrane protein YckC